MSDDMVMHFSSNSSNQSDHSLPDKIAKLEARLTGKTPSSAKPPQLQQQQVSVWSSASSAAVKVVTSTPPGLSETSISDSDDENTGDFLIRANTKKRQKVQESNNFSVVDHVEPQEAAYDGRKNDAESKTGLDVSKKKQGRGRASSTGRGRGSKTNNEVTKSQFLGAPVSAANQQDVSEQKDFRPDGQLRNGECSLHDEVKDLKDQEQQGKQKTTKVISDLLISVSKTERQEARTKVRHESLRLGSVGVLRTGTIIAETWEDGQMLKDLNAQLRQLLETKEAIERQRKFLKKRQNGGVDKNDGTDTESGAQEEDIIPDEVYKSRLASIKREEEVVLRERERYTLEKGLLMREMKRIRDEDGSRFNNFPVLNSRYALLNLLGKGGFSEVYKAYDLVDHRYVACKLHGLNAQWSEEKKQSYIRHANRECEIHKSLVHHHIVRLWDKFHIDMHTFCTVLEYCSGKDLDAVLKATPNLPEKEARIIIVQIVQGLVYLNKKSQKIIHYDLKPGNVLFDEFGVAKVTDFGLSKIVEDNVGSQGMELTSQGAGTYWYLPPECFELNKTPMISSKVDVWSVGVLFYQMLFGKRPFGHDQSQERILREDTIIKAKKVEFPVTRPAISNEAKELIRRCLTYNQADRPDVLTMAQDPYLSYSKK
ncbi:serine/threonine-protein kinase TOUSLED isoform X3 [Arabidopsis lyrata subsp. lyrata]|uniref:serine/threonine-protein kinase TOUSLED isoform X3 n=1 Tax=Arabidopsis lyrata subsp. lyrata TaxID=81972 RepID=UPI000A29CE44|nr:serine/threonine-protein kinase TOUSLED isoform X3 [Arabidopsis lyrata subsp. lyrata]|eukprot:XP_020877550.1 serine/threonine-protein kinase TOUSLED isoform X3 [Arabidopsis lyrata subsp. lyrata]